MSRSTVYVTSDAFHTVVTAIALTLWGLVFGMALVTLTALIWHPLRIFFERRTSRPRRRARGPGDGTMPRRPRQGAADPYPALGTVSADQVYAMNGPSTLFEDDEGPHCPACHASQHMDDYWRTPGLWYEPDEPACGETITTWKDGDHGYQDAAEVVEHCLLTSGHDGRHRGGEPDLTRWGHYDVPIAQPPAHARLSRPTAERFGDRPQICEPPNDRTCS